MSWGGGGVMNTLSDFSHISGVNWLEGLIRGLEFDQCKMNSGVNFRHTTKLIRYCRGIPMVDESGTADPVTILQHLHAYTTFNSLRPGYA